VFSVWLVTLEGARQEIEYLAAVDEVMFGSDESRDRRMEG
jgi:hypothetical protein